MTLALFDFDGTITSKDSLLHFTNFAKGRFAFYTGMVVLLPFLLLNKCGLLSAETTKNIFISWFFKNMNVTAFSNLAETYVANKINSIIFSTAVEKIKWHLQNGHRVIVISASPEDYLQKWCAKMHIECIGTRLQKKENKLTGKVNGRNCKGQEKVNRLALALNIKDYTEIYGYGNSSGDKQMLALCTNPFFKIFR